MAPNVLVVLQLIAINGFMFDFKLIILMFHYKLTEITPLPNQIAIKAFQRYLYISTPQEKDYLSGNWQY